MSFKFNQALVDYLDIDNGEALPNAAITELSDLIAAVLQKLREEIAEGGGGSLFDYIPEDALTITGDCKYKFSGNWCNWFISKYSDIIKTENITNAANMFFINEMIEKIPFDFNFGEGTRASVGYMFFGCHRLEEIGDIKNLYLETSTSYMFGYCGMLRYLPNFIDCDFSYPQSQSYISASSMFIGCYSLRSVPESFLKEMYAPITSPYLAPTYSGFYECHNLDEIRGINVSGMNMTDNMFHKCFGNCYRVKDIIFAEVTSPASLKNQTIDLTQYVGNSPAGSTGSFLNFNSGITADKIVTDAESYQRLKDDPDWATDKIEFSRYNHDSAVRTIKSLPQTDGGNTIKFRGDAGSATDGGAINTLTEEEIAVAASKGWTVSFI